MNRNDIISLIGSEYLKQNTEAGEWSYHKSLSLVGKNYRDFILPNALRSYKDVDLRFVSGNLTVLVETKQRLFDNDKISNYEQLQHYVVYEKELTGNKVIAILASTLTSDIQVWQDGTDIINDEHVDKDERVIKSMEEYKNKHFGTRNDKIAVIQNTYSLNELLHNYSIDEKIRSQFVGTCLLSLKNGLKYEDATAKQIRSGIEEILEDLLDNDINKAGKLAILKNKVVDSQDVRDLTAENFRHILRDIDEGILPYINDKSTMGQDLLNLFFTTFNKYVGKSDKNQAFTPDHIVHFMCRVVGINRHSVVLDPTCGSGAFLVRAMTEAMDDCDTELEREEIKRNQIYGIEYEETAFGLATTNMLIHGDGNSNIIQGNCFIETDYIDANINTVLMNPPYNAQRKHSNSDYVETWAKSRTEDPSKGFHFVYYTAEKVKTGKLAVLLPMQCAISTKGDIKMFKKKMLSKHTLDAVFSFPADMFHPGASAVACCMIFNLGVRHENSPIKETFFGYFKDDGHEKKKNIGRVEKEDGLWQNIEEEWLELYFKRKEKDGLSVNHIVTENDEWLAEAFMETDYSGLNAKDFQSTLNDYLAFLVSIGERYEH